MISKRPEVVKSKRLAYPSVLPVQVSTFNGVHFGIDPNNLVLFIINRYSCENVCLRSQLSNIYFDLKYENLVAKSDFSKTVEFFDN